LQDALIFGLIVAHHSRTFEKHSGRRRMKPRSHGQMEGADWQATDRSADFRCILVDSTQIPSVAGQT
jgi:hypothetical protein